MSFRGPVYQPVCIKNLLSLKDQLQSLELFPKFCDVPLALLISYLERRQLVIGISRPRKQQPLESQSWAKGGSDTCTSLFLIKFHIIYFGHILPPPSSPRFPSPPQLMVFFSKTSEYTHTKSHRVHLFSVGQLFLPIQTAFRVCLIYPCHSLKRTNFSLPHYLLGPNSFLVEVGLCTHFAFSGLEFICLVLELSMMTLNFCFYLSLSFLSLWPSLGGLLSKMHKT